MTINIDALAEQYYAPYDPEFYQDTVTNAVTGEEIDPEETPTASWLGEYFTPDTFPEFAEEHPDLLEEYLDDDDPLSDFETNSVHREELVKRAGQMLFGSAWRKGENHEHES